MGKGTGFWFHGHLISLGRGQTIILYRLISRGGFLELLAGVVSDLIKRGRDTFLFQGRGRFCLYRQGAESVYHGLGVLL